MPSADIGIPNPIDTISGHVGSYVGGQIVDAVTALLRALSDDFLRQLAAPVARYVLSTPDLMTEPTLRSYWAVSMSALLACAGFLVALGGLGIITGRSTRIGQASRVAISTRLPACALTASISLPLVALEVDLANRLVGAFVTDGFASGNNPLWNALSAAAHGDAGAGLALLVTSVVAVVLLVGLVVVGLARWATLWLLVILAPVAMGFAILPGGEAVARLWWRLQLATVFLPVVNAVLLGTYVAMFTSDRSGLVGALSGVAVLALMTKLPSWVAGTAVGVDGHDVAHRFRRGTAVVRRAAVTAGAAAAGVPFIPGRGSSTRSGNGATESGAGLPGGVTPVPGSPRGSR
ncbi:MAG: hypothetical protein QOJ79_1041 [Actinomycetota bacterium]|nr:hypothetical protein [Actinomycetota bacterium]